MSGAGAGGFFSGVGQMFQGLNSAQGAQDAAGAQMDWGQRAMDQAKGIYETNNVKYNPYTQTGSQAETQLQEGMGQNGSLGRKFTMADFQQDPAYKFNVQQGLQAINNSNSVRGGALSGGTQKALTNYAMQQASNEYGNAANRFTQNQNQNFGQLSALAGQGLNAVNAQTNLGSVYSNQMMGQYNNLGNAQAGGILGKVAGENQAIGGVAGMAGSAASMMGS
jgi:hypothetical protein